ncbi:Por secretion system C-terminal sorting domain-containing protein [Flexibacter flexilis DSM 6793]|uniref:Por secretion system C-terminal sorting domain-containing protein n=1 Tax=Flexibacter flexilis DSM 6793 TaxID=927664 RepID=A0A1I1NUI1_9BACT|nr:T9SS type A sorting domain-containing protein [Flexibacter flexilis]SFC99168.1 Por secretion system C-terminal sorting domain-containing protein [Flexibacter flexilis DSM 6793]
MAQQSGESPIFNSVTPISSINTGYGESFPYLSNDSKRLYFIRGNNGRGQLMVTQRNNLGSGFSAFNFPAECNYTGGTNNIFNNISSFYLTPPYNSLNGENTCNIEKDLFTIYYENNIQKMRLFARNNCNSSDPNNTFITDETKIVTHNLDTVCWTSTEINSSLNPLHYHSPSIIRNSAPYVYTEQINGSTIQHTSQVDLYLHYRTSDNKKGIVYLKQYDNTTPTGTNHFVFQYRLAENIHDNNTNTSYRILDGSLAYKDGTRYYAVLKNLSTGLNRLYYINTSYLNNYTQPDSAIKHSNDFSKYVLMEGEGSSAIQNAVQVSFSDYNRTTNRQYMVMVLNYSGQFEQNDIYISQGQYITSTNRSELDVTQLSIVPNPSNGDVTFKLALPTKTKNASIKIYSVQGVMLKDIPINDLSNNNINAKLDDLSAGVYYCVLLSDKGKSSQKFTIIK